MLVLFVVGEVAFSCLDAYVWIEQDSIVVPVEQANFYAGSGLASNQALIVAAEVNHFNKYMVSLYLNTRDSMRDYNDLPAVPGGGNGQLRTPFNVAELVDMCQAYNTRYVLLFEYGKDLQYFQSELTASKIYSLLDDSGYLYIGGGVL